MSEPVSSGIVPFVGESYIARPETGKGPWEDLRPGLTIILSSGGDLPGGTGKTQLAAAFAVKLWAAGALDLLVWLDAVSRDRIITGYARALADIGVAAPPGQPEAAATMFLAWLAGTSRRWLVVLDGLAEPADVQGIWPQGPSGEVVVTTRLAGLEPGLATAAGRQLRIAVPAFSPREALSYMSAQLIDDPYRAAGSLDLVTALDCLPAALNLAVAYLHHSGQGCRRYQQARERYRLDQADRIAYDRLAPSWMLAVDRARQFGHAQLAWPALKLASVLGPAWIPGVVLTSSAACAYVTGRRGVTQADRTSVRAAFTNLRQFGLLAIEPDDDVRTVRMPTALQCSVRRAMADGELRQVVGAAADAVYESWPGSGAQAGQTDLERALRDCAVGIRRCDELALWDRGCHPLLARAGQSLDEARMAGTALRHWRDLARRSDERFGACAPLTLQIRERLAIAVAAAGRTDEAIALRGGLIADIDKLTGPDHPQAIGARAGLARVFRAAGRPVDAIRLGERVASDSDNVLGPAHPQTTENLSELGCAYFDASQYADAISAFQRCLAVREQEIGIMHPRTISTRRRLAEVYRRVDRTSDVISMYEDALVQMEQAVGTDHPDTITAREMLAIARYDAGQPAMAAVLLERVVAEWQRIPDVRPAAAIAARANLAAVYCVSGRLKEAIPLYQNVVADLERVKGADHRDTLCARWKLAAAWHRAKRVSEAVKLGEATLSDCERILGPGHWDTLTARANLAHAYHRTGQQKRARAQFERALHDCEQSIGPDDPLTGQVRALMAGRQGATPIIAPPGVLRRVCRQASSTAELSSRYAGACPRRWPTTVRKPRTARPPRCCPRCNARKRADRVEDGGLLSVLTTYGLVVITASTQGQPHRRPDAGVIAPSPARRWGCGLASSPSVVPAMGLSRDLAEGDLGIVPARRPRGTAWDSCCGRPGGGTTAWEHCCCLTNPRWGGTRSKPRAGSAMGARGGWRTPESGRGWGYHVSGRQ